MAKPKLAMIPSGYRDGKVYSVLPSNGDGDFTFSRGSGATRVNKDGLIETMSFELGSELVTNGGFATGSGWTKTGGWSFSSGKANESGSSGILYQDLLGITTGDTLKITYEITDYTSGEVRVGVGSGLAQPSGTYRSAVGIYTEYLIKTNSDTAIGFSSNSFIGSIDNVSVREVTSGLDTPRLDYSDSSCPSLLLEPQSTNLEEKSNGFSTWSSNSNIIRTADYIVSPDGTQNATRLQFTANGFCANKTQVLGSYTMSCYAKRNDSGTQDVGFFRNGTNVVNSSWEITSEWKRFSYTFPALNAGAMGIAGNSGADISVYGFQLEGLADYATSYIPTNGAIVTRLADVCNDAGTSDTFNDSEGVLMLEIAALVNDGTSRRIGISDSSISNRVSIEIDETADILKLFIDANTLQVDNIRLTNFTKICAKYKANDYSLWVNGFELATLTTSSNVPSGLDRLNFDGGDLNNDFYGKTKQIQYYNSVLTDSELEELTSWSSFSAMANGQKYNIE